MGGWGGVVAQASVQTYGAFVNFGAKNDGLVHISQLTVRPSPLSRRFVARNHYTGRGATKGDTAAFSGYLTTLQSRPYIHPHTYSHTRTRRRSAHEPELSRVVESGE